jgi:hypothetical protein
MKKEYISDPNFRQKGGSFIQVSHTKNSMKKSFKKQKQ